MKVLITGSNGFIAKNLKLFLKERSDIDVFTFSKANNITELSRIVNEVDFIFHLAGVNRTDKKKEFIEGNITFKDADGNNRFCNYKKT